VGFMVECRRHKIDPRLIVSWLKERIEPWFHTETARRKAMKEIDLRAATWHASGP